MNRQRDGKKIKRPTALLQKNIHAQAWCFVRGSVLPLAGLPIAVGEDHIVQIALDPLVGHCAITLLSSLFTVIVYPARPGFARVRIYIFHKNRSSFFAIMHNKGLANPGEPII